MSAPDDPPWLEPPHVTVAGPLLSPDDELVVIIAPRSALAALPQLTEPTTDLQLVQVAGLLGRDIVVLVLAEAARIHAKLESTHFDVRVHFRRGERSFAEFKQVRALNVRSRGLTPLPPGDQTSD